MTGEQPSILGNERGFAQPLTASAGTWLATPADAAEQTKIREARQILAANQAEGDRLLGDEEHYIRLSLELFRQPLFAPLQFAPWVVEQILAEFGEPPVVEG